jgi:mono/diheme cytochrome c family protein
MKRLVSFLLGVAVVAGVGVVFVIFATHNGPGDSPRDDNNTKTVAGASTTSTGDTTSTTATSGGATTGSTTATTGGAAVTMVAAKKTFVQTCGGCHTLADAGTKGGVGPNLDGLKPDEATVAHQIKNGGGAMPAGLLSGADLTAVAKYVSSVAGKNGATGSSSSGGLP